VDVAGVADAGCAGGVLHKLSPSRGMVDAEFQHLVQAIAVAGMLSRAGPFPQQSQHYGLQQVTPSSLQESPVSQRNCQGRVRSPFLTSTPDNVKQTARRKPKARQRRDGQAEDMCISPSEPDQHQRRAQQAPRERRPAEQHAKLQEQQQQLHQLRHLQGELQSQLQLLTWRQERRSWERGFADCPQLAAESGEAPEDDSSSPSASWSLRSAVPQKIREASPEAPPHFGWTPMAAGPHRAAPPAHGAATPQLAAAAPSGSAASAITREGAGEWEEPGGEVLSSPRLADNVGEESPFAESIVSSPGYRKASKDLRLHLEEFLRRALA